MQARVSLWLHPRGVEGAVLQILNKAGLVSGYDKIHDIIKQRINLGNCIYQEALASLAKVSLYLTVLIGSTGSVTNGWIIHTRYVVCHLWLRDRGRRYT